MLALFPVLEWNVRTCLVLPQAPGQIGVFAVRHAATTGHVKAMAVTHDASEAGHRFDFNATVRAHSRTEALGLAMYAAGTAAEALAPDGGASICPAVASRHEQLELRGAEDAQCDAAGCE